MFQVYLLQATCIEQHAGWSGVRGEEWEFWLVGWLGVRGEACGWLCVRAKGEACECSCTRVFVNATTVEGVGPGASGEPLSMSQ